MSPQSRAELASPPSMDRVESPLCTAKAVSPQCSDKVGSRPCSPVLELTSLLYSVMIPLMVTSQPMNRRFSSNSASQSPFIIRKLTSPRHPQASPLIYTRGHQRVAVHSRQPLIPPFFPLLNPLLPSKPD